MKVIFWLFVSFSSVWFFGCTQPTQTDDVAEYQDLLIEKTMLIDELQGSNSKYQDLLAEKTILIDELQGSNSNLERKLEDKQLEIKALLKGGVEDDSQLNQKLSDLMHALEFLRLEEELFINMLETNALEPFLTKGFDGMNHEERLRFIDWGKFADSTANEQDGILSLIYNTQIIDALKIYRAINNGETMPADALAKGLSSGYDTGELVDLANQNVDYLANLYNVLIRSAE